MEWDTATPQDCAFVSVIVPAHNVASTLGEQLDALMRQDYRGNWEIIIVDNGSTDGTVDVVRAYQCLMPQLRLVSAPEKQHISYAKNTGAAAARGDYLLFCDGDDVVGPGWLAAMAKALETHDLVAGRLEIKRLNEDTSWRPDIRDPGSQAILNFMAFAPGCNMGCSRRAYEAAGGFKEDTYFCEDNDFSWRLQLEHGYTLQPAPEAVVHYRYRRTLEALWQQTVKYAMGQVWLYRRFGRHGMPRPGLRRVGRRYLRLVKKLPVLWRGNQKARYTWLRQAAVSWGRLRGSIKFRTLYL